MILFDVTKCRGSRHRSGLTRVSQRLQDGLGPRAQAVAWDATACTFSALESRPLSSRDWLLTTELFSEEERPGFSAFLAQRRCRCAAVFHDAIPLKHPHITWPQSVARHPGYLKLLARFDRVWAVSAASREELLAFWRWQEVPNPPPVDVLALGADFNSLPRRPSGNPTEPLRLLCLGILEPRKNQLFLLEVCEALWREGLRFELHLVGRVNPHFGQPIVDRIRELQRSRSALLHYHAAARDTTLASLYAGAQASLFPTIAEGCGLPLLESLWMGVPCVCSDLPVLRENADAGGCLAVTPRDHAAWREAIRRIVSDPRLRNRLAAAAAARSLPVWSDAAGQLAAALT